MGACNYPNCDGGYATGYCRSECPIELGHELKRNTVFVMDGGTLTMKQDGPSAGWASLVIKSDQLLSEDGYETWEIPPSELRQLRDWLNKNIER